MFGCPSDATIRDVEREQVELFVNEYLSGALTPAGQSLGQQQKNAERILSYHLPKSHHKSRSGWWTSTGGSLVYYCGTKTMKLIGGDRADMKSLWKRFRKDPTPEWRRVQGDPGAYDGHRLASGKHEGDSFLEVYKGARRYVDWLLRGPDDGDPKRGRLSLSMRMFVEYCGAKRAGTPPAPRKRPASARRPPSTGPRKRWRSGVLLLDNDLHRR